MNLYETFYKKGNDQFENLNFSKNSFTTFTSQEFFKYRLTILSLSLFLLIHFKHIDIKTSTLRRDSTNERTKTVSRSGFEISCNARRRYAHVIHRSMSIVPLELYSFRKRKDRPSPDTRENFRLLPPPPRKFHVNYAGFKFHLQKVEVWEESFSLVEKLACLGILLRHKFPF